MAGPCLNTLTIKDGKRQTIADAYLTPAAGRANLTLLLETERAVADPREAGAASAPVSRSRRSLRGQSASAA